MKKYKPTTPSRRNMSVVDYRKSLTTSKPKKSLTKGFRRGTGRNNQGRLTTRHKGGGHKRRFREIDFRYDKLNIPAKVETIEYDPNRTGFIALVCYADGERRYILAPRGVEVGSELLVSETAPVKPGNRLPLSKIPVGTFIYNLELRPGQGAQLIRSAGSYGEVVAVDEDYVNIKLPSSEVRRVLATAWASIGEVSNEKLKLAKDGKAGRSRWRGIRPTVRGSVMNPVDHPYGGGEGKQGRGRRRAVSKWGKPTGIGHKTRRAKKYSNRLVVSRRRAGKRLS